MMLPMLNVRSVLKDFISMEKMIIYHADNVLWKKVILSVLNAILIQPIKCYVLNAKMILHKF